MPTRLYLAIISSSSSAEQRVSTSPVFSTLQPCLACSTGSHVSSETKAVCLQAFDSLLLLPTLQSLELGPITGTVDTCHLGMVLGTLTALTSLDLDFEWCACWFEASTFKVVAVFTLSRVGVYAFKFLADTSSYSIHHMQNMQNGSNLSTSLLSWCRAVLCLRHVEARREWQRVIFIMVGKTRI